MEAQVAAAMEAGAFGLSTSLQYVPDRFARTDELVALARVAGRYGGSYITHQRSEADAIDESLDEVFRIAREGGVPAIVHHLKTAYRQNWGRMPQVLARIERARAEGLDIAADQYPYVAGSNPLDASLPVWAREGGRAAMVARLKDPADAGEDQGRDPAAVDDLGEPVPGLGRRRRHPRVGGGPRRARRSSRAARSTTSPRPSARTRSTC